MYIRPFIGLCAVLGVLMFSAPGSFAQTEGAKPKPFPEFSAKRQKPPKKGSRKRITIQITPDGPKAGAIVGGGSSASNGSRQASAAGSYAWFWDTVPTALDRTGGRYQTALNRLNNPPTGSGVRAPRLQTLYTISQAHGVEILKSTIGKSVLMQLMPATAERFGVSDSTVPAQNIAGGVAYLDWLMGEFDNDPVLALAGYNAGEGAVRSARTMRDAAAACK